MLYFLYTKCQAFSHLQWLYRLVCVRPRSEFTTLVFSCCGSNLKTAIYTYHSINFNKICCKLIMRTCPCNEHPLTPHFYIVKLGFTRVYISFLFLAHLSRRLKSELIVYQSSCRLCGCVCGCSRLSNINISATK